MGNDLSFNIVALDRASTAFLSVAAQVEELVVKLNKLDGKTVTSNVNVKTDESRKALDSFTSRFQLMAAGIAAAAPLAGAAIIGGIGAGFIGAAVLAQKSNQDIQKTYSALWTNVVGSTKAATEQLVPAFVGAGQQMNAAVNRLGPQMKAAFSAAEPDIAALTRGVTTLATNAMPGITSAMQNSLPVFSAAADVMGILGTAVGSMSQSVGANAQNYGTFLRSVGEVTSSVLGTVVNLVNDVAQIWAQNAGGINASIKGIGEVISGLASGAVPVLSAALSGAAKAITTITDVLGPLSPILGTVATAALTLWAAFKVADLVATGIKAVAGATLSMGVSMETGAARGAALIASQQGVAVSASTSAVALRGAGAAAGTAALGFSAAVESLAGPIGIALVAVTAGMALFSSSTDSASASASAAAQTVDELTAALEKSHGAWNQAADDALKMSPAFKSAVEAGKDFGLSQEDILKLVKEGGWDAVIARIKGVADAMGDAGIQGGGLLSHLPGAAGAVGGLGDKANDAVGKLNALRGATGDAAAAAANNGVAQGAAAFKLAESSAGMAAASGIATSFGMSLGSVQRGFYDIVNSAGNAGLSVAEVAAKFRDGTISILNSEQAISDKFKQADQAVVTARQGVTEASHSYAASQRSVADAQHSAETAARAVTEAELGVADAQHSVEAAQRSVLDAVDGLTTARQAYQKSLEDEKRAEADVHVARQQAIQDLKDLHLQLEDQVVSEESARVRLFESQQKALQFGVTDKNVASVAAEPVTFANIDKVKAAIDLQSAQNTLNNALNSGTKVRQAATDADQAGVDGAKGVVSAQQQLKAAQDQVTASAKGVTKAQQSVEDANYSLSQANRGLSHAQQAVTDASYAEQKAHQAVTDAQYASQRAAGQLQKAKEGLTTAEGDASRTLDLNTAAGRRNFEMLKTMSDAITAVYGPTADSYNRIIQQTADKFGISKEAAADMLHQLGLIPPDFKYGVTAVATVDTASLQQVFKSTSAGGYFNDSMNQKKTIGATGLAAGGPVEGPGGPRDDVIPIWASAGEYMQPAHVVSHYGIGFMEALRRKKIPRGGDGASMPGYADGGVIGLNALGAGTGAAYMSTVNAQTVAGLPHPAQLPKYVPPPVMSFAGSNVDLSGIRGSNQAIVQQVFASMFGWTGGEWDAAVRLIMGESGFNNTAQNPVSTAYGMFQFLNSTWGGYGIPKTSDPTQQAIAGGRYIAKSYGSPSRAFAAWSSRSPHWYADGGEVGNSRLASAAYGSGKARLYDNGGVLEPGQMGVNHGSRPEAVLTPDESEAYKALAQAAAAGTTGGNHYHLTVVNAGNKDINLRAQFKRLELEGGLR